MAVRLSVIMVHSPPPTSTAQQLAQGVVGELIGIPGIDLTLVEPLDRLQATSTDQLTLASLGGDVAVLDWQSPAEILALLKSIEFDGNRSPHQHDREVSAPPANSRRIYAYDLNTFSRAEDVIAALSRLNADRQVRAFSLGPLPISSALKSNSGPGQDAPAEDNLQATKKNLTEPNKPDPLIAAQSLPESVQPQSKGSQPPPVGDQRLPQSQKPLDLDDLLDQLDRSDT
jgi:hypothetical protein